MDKPVKTFIIDTNVLIHRPDAVFSFRDNEVVIPLWVLEELDRLKTYSDERGRNARHAIRFLDEISKGGDLREGVKMENGSVLRVILTHAQEVPLDLQREKSDNKIILAAYQLQQEGKQVFFVSKDINARVKATALGIKAVDYEKQKVNIDKLYSGFTELDVSYETIRTLTETGRISWNEQLPPNAFVIFRESREEYTERLICRFDAVTSQLVLMERRVEPVCGIMPLNEEQDMALELLLDDSVSLVTLVGKAGTGKTLLAIAAGLRKVIEDKTFARVLVTRPVIPMGKDIGFLPGAKDEKLSHWMQPLFDNLEFISQVYKSPHFKSIDQLMNNKMIELEALSFIRGRSLPKQYIIIDEAQNLSPHEIKTIVSRAGEGSKVVLTGDPYQIDSPYLDANSNGLTYLVETFKGQQLFGHITLSKSERSPLAEMAAEMM
ncbi:MAG: PhoH family protein [Spirochaetales bacterium]|nr:PhoH family protein [Spirochaetales bacterium]MCF7938588.1 PhoH family protein [Spirochaetales bacterium]